MTGDIVGRIKEIWRYPVESVSGERVDQSGVTMRGLVGDRVYRAVDPETGEKASGTKRRWRLLITGRASLPDGVGGAATIALADGRIVMSDAPDAEFELASAWQTPLRLTRNEAPIGDAPLHLLTTASLKAFSAVYPEGRFEAARFRPNIVIDSGEAIGFVEQGWIGATLAIGDGLRVSVGDHCVRCVITCLAQGDLPQDPGILETVRRENATRAGILGAPQRPGQLSVGDPVRLLSDNAA